MSFLDSWNAYRQDRANSLGQNTQNGQNSAVGDQKEDSGHIGHIGLKSSGQESPRAKPGDCRQRLSDPGQAGAVSWAVLTTWKDQYPHMRPCPKVKDDAGDWMWINRSRCPGCPLAVVDENRTLQ